MTYQTLPTVVSGEAVETDWGNQVKDNFEAGPRGVLGNDEATANEVSTGSEIALADLSVTVNVASGRKIKITASGEIQVATSGARAIGDIQMDTVDIARWADFTAHANTIIAQQHGSVVVEPSGGSHTFRLTLRRESGSGNITLVAAAGRPATIVVEDIGPA